ncbi:RHS repeat-associated core domain-containing protein [Pseudomonas serbica]
MTSPQQNLLCHYRYDPLDRLISHTQPQEPPLQRFYCNSRLATEIHGALHHSIVQHDNLLLAQQQHQGNALDATLIATDVQRSILHTLKANHQRQPIAYSPYGHRRPESALLSLLGFNGELPDPVTECYLLGNGYRAFNPVLMRFNSPDSWSPFGRGGLNYYAYCLNDPINRYDSSGHFSPLVKYAALKWLYKTQRKSIVPPASFFAWRGARAPQPVLLENNPLFQRISKYLGQEDIDNLMLVSKTTKDNAQAASDANLRARITSMRKEKVPIHSWLQSDFQARPGVRFPKASGIGSTSFKQLDPSITNSKSMAARIEKVRQDARSDIKRRMRNEQGFFNPNDVAFKNRSEDLLADILRGRLGG